jgi:hypothetical protein
LEDETGNDKIELEEIQTQAFEIPILANELKKIQLLPEKEKPQPWRYRYPDACYSSINLEE